MVAILAFALALGGFLLAAPPLYPAYAHQSVRLFGIGPALDQYLAGLVMIGEQVWARSRCASRSCFRPPRERGLIVGHAYASRHHGDRAKLRPIVTFNSDLA